MVIQDSILAIYGPVIKRIRNWGLPLILILLLLSAYGKTSPVLLSYFSAIELASIHFYLGWILGLIWLVLVYDFFFNLFTTRSTRFDSPGTTNIGRSTKSGLTRAVSFIFYLLLFMICLSGLAQSGIYFPSEHPRYLHHVNRGLAHIILGWLCISSALIKYYLSITRRLTELVKYLREN